MKRISQQVRELRPSGGVLGDYSYCHGWSEGLEKASALLEQLEEVGIIERGREIQCAYCECLIYCEPEDPSEAEQEAAKKAFADHDAVCAENPLAKRVAELESRTDSADWLAATLDQHLIELRRNAIPDDCTHCNGSGIEPPRCPESGPCERCGGWTEFKRRIVAGNNEQSQRIRDLESQLAWTPVADGLPAEPGVYELYDSLRRFHGWLTYFEFRHGLTRQWIDDEGDDWAQAEFAEHVTSLYTHFRRIEIPEAT